MSTVYGGVIRCVSEDLASSTAWDLVVVLTASLYLSQGNDRNRDLNKSLRDMSSWSRRMIKWRIYFVISVEFFSHLTKSLLGFSEIAKSANKHATLSRVGFVQ